MLEVTPLGLVGSHRPQAEDGHVFMGTLKHSMPNSQGKYTILNDFVLPPFQMPQAASNGATGVLSDTTNTFQ